MSMKVRRRLLNLWLNPFYLPATPGVPGDIGPHLIWVLLKVVSYIGLAFFLGKLQ